ncbi:hypothetical protein ABPG75_003991 [Micractinium tetrahymenae]
MRRPPLAALLAAALCAAAAAAASLPASITDVRLSGTAAGRLEVQGSDGQWWDALELCVPAVFDSSSPAAGSGQLAELESALANVACRQLGFPGGRPLAAYTPSIQDPPAGPVLSGLLVCSGNETSVDQCDLVESECVQDEAPEGGDDFAPQPKVERTMAAIVCAGVVQLNGQLRLAGGPSLTEGRVEAQLSSGAWTAFCQASSGSDGGATAEVVCRQLGLGGPAALRLGVYDGDKPAAGAGSLTEVLQCAGGEARLGDCFLAPEATDACTLAGTLGVACSGAQTVQQVRLSGGASPAEGLLEVRLAGSDGGWGGVCASQQAAVAASSDGTAVDAYLAAAEAQNAAAEVACRALNLTGGVARVGAGFYSAAASGLPAVLVGGLACSGSEAGLSLCGFSGGSACQEGQCLGAACAGAQTITALRLVGGPTPREGRLEVRVAGQWGTVSALGTTPFEAAAVACRQLGWSTEGVQAQGVSFYGDGALPLLLWGIICDGSEASLSECHLTYAPAGAGPATEAFSVNCAGERAVVGA